jgi:DNA-binding CsgD family transcriptional regulator
MAFALASDALLNAAFTADGMATVLQEIAQSVGAEGATLTYSHRSTQLGAIFSDSLREHVKPYMRPDRPPDPRAGRVNPTLFEGFRVDQEDFTPEELARDPYYQEFLRPLGFGWHACALLAGAPSAETLHLTLRRTIRQGAFEDDDLDPLSAQLPLIRATAKITQIMGGIVGATAEPVPDSRRSLYGFDPKGAAFVIHQGQAATDVMELRGGRLLAWSGEQQERLQATLERATAQCRQVSSILSDADGDWWLFSVSPPTAIVPTWMTPFISWAALVPYGRSDEVNQARGRQMAALFGLSPAEVRVASLIGDAKTISAAARALGASPGTVRNHLKSIFQKVGVNRQAELVAVLSRL